MSELLFAPNADAPPIFISAGIIKAEAQIEQFAGTTGIAAQIIGSFSEQEWGGNDPTGRKTVFWRDQENNAAYNAIGLRNPGRKAASEYLPRALKKVHAAGQLAIISVTSLSHEEPNEVLPRLAEWALDMGADGVEIDGSCPNHGTVLCQDVAATHELAVAVRERLGEEAYISIKFADLPDTTIDQYKQSKLPIDGIALINAIRQRVPINPKTGASHISVNQGYAGKSGPAIANLARNNLAAWSFNADGKLTPLWRVGYQLWSTGGVVSGHEAYDRVHKMGAFMAGAAQPFYDSKQPEALVKKWAREYDESLAKSA